MGFNMAKGFTALTGTWEVSSSISENVIHQAQFFNFGLECREVSLVLGNKYLPWGQLFGVRGLRRRRR